MDLREIALVTSQQVVWLAPVLLAIIAARAWAYYAIARFIAEKKKVLLEIRVPEDVSTAARAMETILVSLHQMGRENNWYSRFIIGAVRPWFSLETVGDAGAVRFFIWLEEGYKDVVTAAISSQYPTAEIHEVSDYTGEMPFDAHKSDMTMYGLECEKVPLDPLHMTAHGGRPSQEKSPTGVSQFLRSLNKGERVWVQILVRATRKQGNEKLCFDAGMRALYFGNHTAFRQSNISALVNVMTKRNVGGMSEYAPGKITSDTRYPWQDFRGMRRVFLAATLYNAYVRRNYFYPPHKRRSFILTQEEIAALYNFSAGSAEISAIVNRNRSKKPEPPPNLPI